MELEGHCQQSTADILWITMCLGLCFTKTEKNNKITQCCSMWENTIQTTDAKTSPKLSFNLKYYPLKN